VKRSLLLVSLLVSSQALAAPWEKSGIDWAKVPPPGPEPTFKVPRGEQFKLANGVRVIVASHRTLPLVTVSMVVVGAGSAGDPAGKSGLGAFAVDLLDEGAGDLDAMGIVTTADALGAEVGVASTMDAASVYASTLPRTLAPTIELMTKIMTQPRFAAADFKRVHEDRVTEIALRGDEGSAIASLVAAAAVLGRDTPYGRPPLGFAAELKSVAREEVMGFYAARFRPEKTVIVVVGDVTAAEVRPILERTIGTWRPGKAMPFPEPPAALTAAKPPRLVVVDQPGAEQSEVRVIIAGPRFGDPATASLEVTRVLLGGMFSSRLMRRVREQLGYAYTIGARWPALRAASPISIRAGIHTPKTAPAIKEVLAIVNGMSTKPVPVAELRRAQQNLIRGYPENFGTNDAVAIALGDLAVYDLPEDFHEQLLAGFAKVTPKDVQKAARSFLSAAKMTIVIVGDLKVVMPEVGKLKLGAPLQLDVEAQKK
jgi:zinc protease